MNVTLQCRCGRKVHPVPLSLVATYCVNRKCPRCGKRWQIIVRPAVALKKVSGYASTVEWTELL